MTLTNSNNIVKSELDEDTLDLLVTAFQLYEIGKLDYNVYRKDEDLQIARNLIVQYYKRVKPNYNNMIYTFRRKYVSNELLVEKNDTPEERKGLNLVYDFIQYFDIDEDPFNIFMTSLQIHSLLFKPLDEKNSQESDKEFEKAKQLMEEAKEEKDIKKLLEARKLLKSISCDKFGGQLRQGNVLMNDFHMDIVSAHEARDKFNSFLTPVKKKEYEDALNNPDIFQYIDYAVNTTCDLIGLQPFTDGNKRTFRSLLNLMFKKKNLPPVYITRKERKTYHQALEKALCEHDYSDLDAFYYYKICDSIYELDFKPYLESVAELVNEESKRTIRM